MSSLLKSHLPRIEYICNRCVKHNVDYIYNIVDFQINVVKAA
ncbi:unnamed protein product [Acanthoscelides obtectus]|uniref:Uncharacterized protein n=1 Tax=Acanthoscelides obtectus TaxID=200917 RepID=A0A9P0JZF0_ACAOB|nr:unnamed protein product [Acanthoscelides obtectus]CAK1621932.1 hypothetical protein AOBTE_LOCUS1221 [Acanthoscelides obtectus]